MMGFAMAGHVSRRRVENAMGPVADCSAHILQPETTGTQRTGAPRAARALHRHRGMQVTSDSAKRVPEHTATDVNLAIAERTKESIAHYDDHREHIPRRLGELDREWDVERMLALGSSCIS